jgi:hypothetical protein
LPLADSFNAPLLITLGDQQYRLAYLTMDDLAQVARETLHDAKQAAMAGMDITKKREREEVAAYFDGLDLDMNELARACMTLKGSRRFVVASLGRGKHTKTEADAFVDELTASEGYLSLGNLACRVSRLFKPVIPAPLPNAEAAEASKSPSAANESNLPTGQSSEQPSAEPSAAETLVD